MPVKQRTFVVSLGYDADNLRNIDEAISDQFSSASLEAAREHLIDFPTVYVIHDKSSTGTNNFYVGETNNIQVRTTQHLTADRIQDQWKQLASSHSSSMFVIGNTVFTKSMTLDIEHRLMHYLSAMPNNRILNARGNEQGKYYTKHLLDEVFRSVWTQLRQQDKNLFPLEQIVRDSALFKASPLHTLTEEQHTAKREILLTIQEKMEQLGSHQPETLCDEGREQAELVLVTGDAGSGKTVLISSLFYSLRDPLSDTTGEHRTRDAFLLVGHDQQLNVYRQIARNLGILDKDPERVMKPTPFINTMRKLGRKVDIVLIDEAHLLLTQGKQGYSGKNQLRDIMELANIVVAVYDRKQVLETPQIWEDDLFTDLHNNASVIELRNQMRIGGSQSTVDWLRTLIDDQRIEPLPPDETYDIRIFDSPHDLKKAIDYHASSVEHGLSRMLATYDWPYSAKNKRNDGRPHAVEIGDFAMPWNYETHTTSRTLAWAENPAAASEIGSTFSLQGFDLNYAGVILGESIRYEDGRIILDPSKSFYKKATQKRTLSQLDSRGRPVKADYGVELKRNELNVLLTRGVNGLYIYAVDEPLREALKEAVRQARVSP